MLGEIFRFEWRFRARQPQIYIFAALFALLAFGAVASDVVHISGGGVGSVAHNASFSILGILSIMSMLGVLIATAFMATAVNRDYQLGTDRLFFTTPMRKRDYLLGRFLGSGLATFLVVGASALGLAIGTLMPWQDPEQILPFSLLPYVHGLAWFVLPNLFLTGALFFALATLTRRMLATYVGVLGFFLVYGLTQSFLSDLDSEWISALLDPFGFGAFELTTRYWTVAERNTMVPDVGGILLWNRLLWVGVGALILTATTLRFRLTLPEGGRWFRRRRATLAPAEPESSFAMAPIPRANQTHGWRAAVSQWRHQAALEIRQVTRSTPFIIILLFATANVFMSAWGSSKMYGTSLYPVTHLMLQVVSNTYALFVLIVVTFYAGELVWKERSVKLNEVYDALPVSNWIPLAGKLTALVVVVVPMLVLGMLAGLVYQGVNGYFDFELSLYLKSLLAIDLSRWVLFCVLAIATQALVNHKYLGFGLMVLVYISYPVLSALDFDHSLYRFGGSPSHPYSDMNGYGHFVEPVIWFRLYWYVAAAVLVLIAHVAWVRGSDTSWRIRWSLARQRLDRPHRIVLGLALVGLVSTGGWIFYNTNIVNEYTPADETERLRTLYEQRYKQYEHVAQPRITAASLEVDISPHERRVDARGELRLRNKTDEVIETLHLRLDPELTLNGLSLPKPSREHADDEVGYYIYRLAEPLAPKAEMTLKFDVSFTTQGFKNHGSNNQVVYNGTFFNNGMFVPSIGYSRQGELSDPNERRKRELPERPRMAPPEDMASRMNTYISHEADWIEFEAIVSTSPDQIAIAPGYLQREWQENGRRYFHYEMDAPILPFYAFLSADYTVARDHWNDVAIEVYYHGRHDYNVDRMIDSVKKSLDYFTVNFSPYQHRQVRIIEFPRYASFAQSFPNTIPYSESIGFIADLRDPDDIDYVFYVTAHEVAHQWWAHQVIGGDVQGGTLMSETMAQYSALMVMEKEYGREKMNKFLEYELNRYLIGRGLERHKELPLAYVENQPYIHYRKGSLVMYALREYIGEDQLNRALQTYIENVAFQEPPFTTSLEFIEEIRKVVPEDRKYLVEDLFETITLYDNRAKSATVIPTEDGRFRVQLTVQSKKLRADEQGTETEAELDDLIQIGIFGEDEDGERKPLYLEMHRLTEPVTDLEVIVDEEPTKAGIDPMILLIDRNPRDNVTKVEAE